MKKNPGIAALLSFIFPGAGFIYCERYILGIIFSLWWLLCINNVLHPASRYGEDIIAIVTWIVAILLSAKTAKSFNNRNSNSSTNAKSSHN